MHKRISFQLLRSHIALTGEEYYVTLPTHIFDFICSRSFRHLEGQVPPCFIAAAQHHRAQWRITERIQAECRHRIWIIDPIDCRIKNACIYKK